MRAHLLVAFALALLSSAKAAAESKHEIAKASAMKRGGAAVGVRLRVVFKPAGGQDTVLLSLTKLGVPYDSAGGAYHQAHSMASGALLHQFPEIRVEGTAPFEQTFELEYGAQGLKAGDKVGVVSAWRRSGATNWHAWGQWAYRADVPNQITLPTD